MLTFIVEHWQMLLAVTAFLAVFVAIIFEFFDKTILALTGGALFVLTRILTFDEAVSAINFEIIALLAAMMIIVQIAKESGLFSYLNLKLAQLSKGNPFLIFLLFTVVTAVASAFLDNVTTILIVVPITIALTRGMGYNPFPFVMAEILLSNIGGALTLVGDPPNVLVGTAVGFSFNSFIVHLWIPILAIVIFTLLAFFVIRWKDLKPIHHHLPKLFMGNLLLQKIQYEYVRSPLNPRYMITVATVLGLTIVGFLLHSVIHLPVALVALTGALTLMLVVHKKIHVHHVFSAIEWSTLGFFAGLFVMVAGLEAVHVLEMVAGWIMGMTSNFALLILIIVWSAGLLSMVVDNIPFVTVMIPVLFEIQSKLPPEVNGDLLWWGLILGAALGGNGTIIGASANVIGSDIARKEGVPITFLSYFKYAFPLTVVALMISSIYLLVWNAYF